MMNTIWAALMLFSFFCAIATGRVSQLSDAVLSGAGNAVELVLAMLGMMCAWTGLMKIADAGGVTILLSKLFYPVTKYLFPKYKKGSPAARAICMNMTANLLGLGNAATPLGIAAMKEMTKVNSNSSVADDSMAMFVVINTASIQLIPTTIGVLRAKYGSATPFDILPAVWAASAVSLIVGILVAKLLENRKKVGGKDG